jgi:hypothetical protein
MTGLHTMIDKIKELLEIQRRDIKKMNLADDEIKDFVFGEGDVVEQYLIENDIKEDDVNLEALRDLQHAMVAGQGI